MSTTAGTFESWTPKEFGMVRATAMSVVLFVVIAAFCLWAGVFLAPKPKPAPIQVTTAQLVTLPKPTPPPPPKVIPPPKPLPAIIPKPLPVPSKIVVATKPPPPVHHVYKPVTHPVVHAPTPPTPVARPTPPAAPPAPPSNGIPVYGRELHAILEQNQQVPQALAQLGISGTALIFVTVAPDGHVISATLAKSSGIKLIDQTALAHALEAHFSPFTSDMPGNALRFEVPVTIQPADNSDSSGDSDSDDSN